MSDPIKSSTAEALVTLRATGLRAGEVHDGPAAVRLVQDKGVDVCILKLVMTGMNGVEIYEQILGWLTDRAGV